MDVICIMSSMTKAGLARQIVEVAQLKGTFLLRSGQTSDTYFDKYQFESRPQLLASLAQLASPLIPPDTEVLAGLELGGVAFAVALSLQCGLPVCFVRKKAKEYGTCRLAEGASVEGKKVLIVEDVVTSGGQVLISGKDLRDLGARITDVLCVIDREQGGREALSKEDYNLISVFTRTELQA